MATPLFKALKNNGYSTYVLPGASEDISSAYQNDNYKVNFSKFALLNLDLEKMDLDDNDEFNTESFQTITDKGDLLVNHLRNYVANHEVVIRESLLNNNNSFYDPNILRTASEKVFWKWLRKTDIIEWEPAIPNSEYIDSNEFAVDQNSDPDFFKEYLWKERSVIPYSITGILDTTIDKVDPKDGLLKRVYRIQLGSTTNIKPGDTVILNSDGVINIGFTGEKEFTVDDVSTDTAPENDSKNNWVFIFSDSTLIFNNFATATLKLKYKRVVEYIGEISSINNVQNKNNSYTEVLAFVPNQTGKTPDILWRTNFDSNYSPGLQYPILPSQDQPEIVGGEQPSSPIVLNPEAFPGDQYAYFDRDQKYINSPGLQDRRRGEYFGVLENNRNAERVSNSPFVYPEFNGDNLDGLNIDFDPNHYVKMNLPGKKADNFDEFNALSIDDNPPEDFKFNAILWYYEVEDRSLSPTSTEVSTETETEVTEDETINTTTITREETTNNNGVEKSINLYAITFLGPVEDNEKIELLPKLVTNGEQDGLSYQFSLNLNFEISSEQTLENFDENKIYSLFGFDLFNEVMIRVAQTNDVFNKLSVDVSNLQKDISNLRSLIYTQTDLRDINSRIDSLNKLLNLYKRNQIKDSDSIITKLDETTTPPSLLLEAIDSRYSDSIKLPVSLLYNNQNNTVIDKKITVPKGKDFLVNIINDDNSDITLDRNLNIVLNRDLDFKQTCEIKIYPNNSRFNKKLNISINTKLVDNIDNERGYQLFDRSFDLPIDNNLNPNEEIESIYNRWNKLPGNIYPESIKIRKISDSYFIVVELRSIQISSFRSGDVLFLENFNFVEGEISSDISGQYEIVGEIENNELVFPVNNSSFISLFDKINENRGNQATHELISENFTQPSYITINSGYSVKITANDRVSDSISEKYLIEVNPLRKEI